MEATVEVTAASREKERGLFQKKRENNKNTYFHQKTKTKTFYCSGLFSFFHRCGD